MGLDMPYVSSPLYPFPSPFLLGDLVNANPGIIIQGLYAQKQDLLKPQNCDICW